MKVTELRVLEWVSVRGEERKLCRHRQRERHEKWGAARYLPCGAWG